MACTKRIAKAAKHLDKAADLLDDAIDDYYNEEVGQRVPTREDVIAHAAKAILDNVSARGAVVLFGQRDNCVALTDTGPLRASPAAQIASLLTLAVREAITQAYQEANGDD